MKAETLVSLARQDKREDIAVWIEDQIELERQDDEARKTAPLKTPIGVFEFGKRYDVTVRRRGGINPPSERRLRNVTVGPQGFRQRGLNYDGGRTAVGWYDLHTIIRFEEVK